MSGGEGIPREEREERGREEKGRARVRGGRRNGCSCVNSKQLY